jgi:hypothetical protein
MPSFDTDTQDKIVLLRGLRALGTQLDVHELVKIAWTSDPDDAVYYSVQQTDQVADPPPPVSQIEARIIPDNRPNWFVPVTIDGTIGDESIDLTLWDGDFNGDGGGAISDLLLAFGEGCAVTLLYWFPQVELLLPIWDGHLEYGGDSDLFVVKIKASQGFQSTDEDMPRYVPAKYCQAVYGALLATQEEINEGSCPSNLHIGGHMGIVNPDTGLPWTFCDVLTIQSCIDRGVYAQGDPTKPWYHLSNATQQVTIFNNQTKGPRLSVTSQANDGDLDEALRVVMGRRRFRGMKVVNYRLDTNTRNPDQGFFQAIHQGPHGPILSYEQTMVGLGSGDMIPVVPLHYVERLGSIGQPPVTDTLSTHAYSGTAVARYTHGPTDPTTDDPAQVTMSSIISGLRNVRVYYDAGNGVVGDYYRRNDFEERLTRRISPTIDFASVMPLPEEGLYFEEGFCIEFIFYISFQYNELYTFTTIQDDYASLWIENTDLGDTPIIDNATYPATGSGTYTPSAINTPIPARLRFKQAPNVAPNPWGIILKWQSASRSLQVVPNDRLFRDATYQLEFTTNRVWQIARMLTDKRWGFGEDYADFNLEMWKYSAEWVDRTVGFTDPFGAVWYHRRASSDVELIARKSQQQVEDMCIAGFLSRPFKFNGQLCIMPLEALSEDDLAACPVFTDEGDSKNILWEKQGDTLVSTLKPPVKKSLNEITNEVKVKFDDATQDWVSTPLRPVRDTGVQLAGGRARGTTARKVNSKEYALLGVTVEGHAVKAAWGLLDRGPCDEGGLQNNLSYPPFKIWFADALDLHPFKVIKIVNSNYAKYGFTYFRIMKMERNNDLTYSLTVQAYNETYMASFETEYDPDDPPVDFPVDTDPSDPRPPDPTPEPLPCILQFDTVEYLNGTLSVNIANC